MSKDFRMARLSVRLDWRGGADAVTQCPFALDSVG